jgi:hypothetical protein
LASRLALLSQTFPDIALVVERWGALPESVRAGIVAMVRATAPPETDPDRPFRP